MHGRVLVIHGFIKILMQFLTIISVLRDQIESTINTNLILLFLLLILGYLAMFAGMVVMGFSNYWLLVVSMASLVFALYYTYVCLRVASQAKRAKIDLFRDEEIGPSFSMLLAGTCIFYASFDMFMLFYLGVRVTLVIPSVALILLGYFGIILKPAVEDIRRRKARAKIKLGFNKQKLPLTIIDFILAGLMFFLADLVSSLKVLLYLIGFLFLAVAVLSLIVKPYRDSRY